MKQYICSVCGYTYDETKGIPEAGIAPGTPFEALPDTWRCPWCGAGKDAFHAAEAASAAVPASPAAPIPPAPPVSETELSGMELSIVCSNLARGCEKQYLPQQAADFQTLADFFRQQAQPAAEPSLEHLLARSEQDLSEGFPSGKAIAQQQADRGALRCQVWSEKVTRMLQSLLRRYAAEGEHMLRHTGVYVCSICGFVYVGDAAPRQCPVCKVPDWKFEKVEGGSPA